ncbi:MAG: hypothetical protein DI623_08545 [Sphingomonas sanxanigenens]|uniref:Xcc1710-like domain-containing protein n=1 Tax=Sphingomonas sanxanigenens TaxID=397260 RepID=A0A2W5A617_9SPHN|nr:MAG: hypothetical protein DI623_08545 [Sphingomonas sanxanigenens]
MAGKDIGVRVARDRAGAGPMVSGFAGRGFRIDGVAMDGALLTPLWAREWADPAIDEAAIADLLAVSPPPEFILIGTGASLLRPPPAFVAAIEARGIGVEAMDSRAAARAWGVLRAEDRWIAAALMPL